MVPSRRILLLLTGALVLGASLLGCERTPEDLEKWRNAQGGMEKMVEWSTSSKEPKDVRIRAVEILIEEGSVTKLEDVFDGVDEGPVRKEMMQAAVQKIEEMWNKQDLPQIGEETDEEGGRVKVGESKAVQAKDAAYFLVSYAEGPQKEKLQAILADWLSKDWQLRDQLGRTTVSQIVPEAGAKGMKNAIRWIEKTDRPGKVVGGLLQNADDAIAQEIAEAVAARAEKEHPDLSGELMSAVMQVEDDAIVPYLQKAVTDPKSSPQMVDGAMERIKKIKGKVATGFFADLITNYDGKLRWAAVNDLIDLRGKAGIRSAAMSLPLDKESYAIPEEGSFQDDVKWFARFVVGKMAEDGVNSISDQLNQMLTSERWPAEVLAMSTALRAATSDKDAEKQLLDPGRDKIVENIKGLTSSRESIPGWGSQMRVGELAHNVLDAMGAK
jgi:hypothetical protein